ncbi:MAG: DUF6456 domain-containing protein [Devosia sp.]|nr:DUF6456 domain-containing protein [Devosia sp.]
MQPASKRAVRFVRALLPDGVARDGGDGQFRVMGPDRMATLSAADIAGLISAGILLANSGACRAGPEARGWLRRQLIEGEPYAGQHRREVRAGDGRVINLSESPLARLAAAGSEAGQPFLAAHQVEAGERLRRLVERAGLRQRVTMAYDPTRTASGRGGGGAEMSDMAADARRALATIMESLPAECAGVVLDVCGLEKGLQQIESERGWPRRSAKLVLRIGLDQLARHFRLAPLAIGRNTGPSLAWMEAGARPKMFAEE